MTKTLAKDKQATPKKLGKYQILKVLGKGSMGVVYKARDPEIDRLVAIKTIQSFNRSKEKEQKLLDRLLAEARSLGKLRHQNIVTIFDASFKSDTPYLVMDFVAGESLAELLKRTNYLAPEIALFYLGQIASAIDYAHKQGVVHRDLKPANCMLELNDRVYVLDFGIAKIQSHFRDHVKQDETILGTPAYMAPEQIRNERIKPSTDLFSFAVMAYQCFTGQRPFEGETYTETMGLILSQDPKPLSEHVDAPLALEAVFQQALDKEPTRRYPTARKFVEACAKACGFKEIPRLKDQGLGTTTQRIAVWDNSNSKKRSQTLYNSNISAPTVKSAEVIGPGAMFSHVDAPVEAQVELYRGLSLTRILIFSLGIITMVSGFYLIGLLLSTPKIADEIPLAVFEDLPTETYKVVVGEASSKPAKTASAMTDKELVASLLAEKLDVIDILEALKELEARNLPEQKRTLLLLLRHNSYLVRLESLKFISRSKDSSYVAGVVSILDDFDPSVRKQGAITLGDLGSRKALSTLKQAYKKETDRVVKRFMLAAIEKISGVPYRDLSLK